MATGSPEGAAIQLRKYRAQLHAADLLVIDDLLIRKLQSAAGDELADVLMSRYEKRATIVTSNRPLEGWATLLCDLVVVTPLLDRLMHHGHLLKFDGKSCRLKESAERLAKRAQASYSAVVPQTLLAGNLPGAFIPTGRRSVRRSREVSEPRA